MALSNPPFHKSIFILLVLLVSCITPIDVDIEEEIKVLVIDGYITTDYGPHEIRITRSARFGDIFEGEIDLVSGALVLIRDHTGETVELSESQSGLYHTPDNFKGEVGFTYSILVETNANERYSSFPETIVPVSPIKEVFFNFDERPTADPLVDVSGLEVFVRFDDLATTDNYYLWEIDGSYRVITRPELYRNPETGQITPKECCAVCYISDPNISSEILSDLDQNGNSIVQKIGLIEDKGLEFHEAYHIVIRQFGINESAYEFQRILRNQLEIEGSIFDPPPATIRSNIINLDNPKATTIGYFGAFDVVEYEAFIDLSLVSDVKMRRQINDDCRLLPNSSITRPEEWN